MNYLEEKVIKVDSMAQQNSASLRSVWLTAVINEDHTSGRSMDLETLSHFEMKLVIRELPDFRFGCSIKIGRSEDPMITG